MSSKAFKEGHKYWGLTAEEIKKRWSTGLVRSQWE